MQAVFLSSEEVSEMMSQPQEALFLWEKEMGLLACRCRSERQELS